MVLPGPRQIETAMEIGERGQPGPVRTGPVIAPFKRDELLLLRLSDRIEIMDNVPDGTVHSIRSAQREIDMVETRRGQGRQFVRKADRRLIAEMEIPGGVGKAPHLFGGDIHNTVLAVADIDAPQSCKAVEHAPPIDIGEPHALGRLQDGGMVLTTAMSVAMLASGVMAGILIWLGPETRGRDFTAEK